MNIVLGDAVEEGSGAEQHRIGMVVRLLLIKIKHSVNKEIQSS